ncbi:MAG TPA: pyridoxamine 5'-phosphate oxidase [Cryomorphaceae bacterium]|nr:pyridoxamine 5'-phosphate oxidase [Cryomorphaceae bacterium]
MKEELRSFVQQDRRDFKNEALEEFSMSDNPFDQFEKWFEQALKSEIQEPYAFTLATADRGGSPSARVLYMRDVTKRGISFFTNYKSDKGSDLAENPKCTANFFWMELDRQVRFSGNAEKLPAEESDAYFESRPRGSQIGAWASDQSSQLENRQELLDKLDSLKEKFEGLEVPRPDHWGGYLIKPERVEFWQGRESRLHDRILYTQNDDGAWVKQRLSP